MSRSYKKTPRCGDKKDRFFKRYYNKRIRQNRKETDGLQYNQYKKYKQAYDICDYETVGITFNEYWRRCVSVWNTYWRYCNKPFPDQDEEYQKWCKWYKRK